MSIWYFIILFIVVVVIFGIGKLCNIGFDFGGVMCDFKKGFNGDDEDVVKCKQVDEWLQVDLFKVFDVVMQSQCDFSDVK